MLALAGGGLGGLSSPVGVASAQTPITGCTTITQPGTYELTQNITNSVPVDDACIEIRTSNVVFDGNGFTIDGLGFGAGVSAATGVPLMNVTVRNVTVTDWDIGIYYEHVSDGAIHDITAQNNREGINLARSSNNNTIANNTVQQNDAFGITLDFSSNNTIANNTIQNSFFGIDLEGSSSNLIYNNVLNNTNNVRVRGGENTWNVTQQPGPNIIGGPSLGGNYYATPVGDGFSQTCSDDNSDGFCDQPKTFNDNNDNVDFLPLTPQQFPDIAVSPSTLSFDTVTVGESATANVTVTNTGGATLDVSATDITGPNASAFTVTAGGAPFTLAPGESHNVTVQFAPDAPGEKQATLTIESTDPDEPTVEVALTGTAEPVFPEPLVIEVRGITLFEIGPPQDLDGDGLYEDVDGDDRFTFDDVVALDIVVTFYESGDLELTDAQVAALDFNRDGRLTEADTRALARQLLLDQ